jgi:hypothetical protein
MRVTTAKSGPGEIKATAWMANTMANDSNVMHIS